MAIDLKLTENEHDIAIENFDFVLIDGLDSLIQKVKIKLLYFYQEWFLDSSIGMDFYNIIFGKKRNLNSIDNLILLTITELDEVTEVLEYESNLDRASRILNVKFKADSVYGTFELEQGLTI